MATTVQFYHLTSTSAQRAVPILMEKALSTGSRVVMMCADKTSLQSMSDALWTHHPDGFLPHDTAQSSTAKHNPIVLALEEANPNQATIACVLHGKPLTNAAQFTKVLDVFDGANETAVAAARERWLHYKAQGFALQYVKQEPKGGWKIEAQAA